MNNILKVSLIVVVTLIIAGGLFFAGSAFGSFSLNRRAALVPPVALQDGQNIPAPGDEPGQGQGLPGGRGGRDEMPGRDGRGGMRDERPERGGMGQGRPDGGRSGMGGGPGMGGGMGPGMGRPGGGPVNVTPLTADEAQKAAEDYIASLNIDGLEVAEVLTFDRAAYVSVKETATGNGAFELLIDPVSKTAHPGMGPASAWNLKYGGVLQTNRPDRPKGQGAQVTPTPNPEATAAPAATPADVSAEMPLSQEDAIQAAQAFLDEHHAGATAATTALQFYGYYSIDFSKDGEVIGKLSVNGYNGLVVGHAWNGQLSQQK